MGSVVAWLEWVGEAEVYVGVVAYRDGLGVGFAGRREEFLTAGPAGLHFSSCAEFLEARCVAGILVYLTHMVSHAGSQHSAAASLEAY